jgi:hypothetical protein
LRNESAQNAIKSGNLGWNNQVIEEVNEGEIPILPRPEALEANPLEFRRRNDRWFSTRGKPALELQTGCCKISAGGKG